MFVLDRLTAVVGLPTFAQSSPASPPALTSSVRAATVGLSEESLRSVKEPSTEPARFVLPTMPPLSTTWKVPPAL